MIDLLQDTNLWLGFSFVIFCFILWKAGKNAVISMLDSRIQSIREELETSESLRVEAQELLAQYQRKYRDAMSESEAVVANAEKHAKQIKKQAETDLKETIKRREKQLQDRIERMKNDAIQEIKAYASDLAIHTTTEIIAQELDAKGQKKILDASIASVKSNIH